MTTITRALLSAAIGVLAFVLYACTEQPKPAASTPTPVLITATPPRAPATSRANQYDAELTAIARDYFRWPRLGQMPGYMSALCAPPQPFEYEPIKSEASSKSPHGQKLYWLHASDVDWYVALNASSGEKDRRAADAPMPASPRVGATIVKASFERPSTTTSVLNRAPDNHDAPDLPSTLFVMHYVGADKADSDNGWVYATIDAATLNISSSGVVASCAECHRDAPYGRLFGASPKIRLGVHQAKP